MESTSLTVDALSLSQIQNISTEPQSQNESALNQSQQIDFKNPLNPIPNKIFTKKKIKSFHFKSNKRKLGEEPIKAQKEDYLINLEDLLMLEEKMNYILQIITKEELSFSMVSKSSFDYWNFYFNCSLKGSIENYFLDKNSNEIVQNFTRLKLVSLMIIYDSSFKRDYFFKIFIKINNLMILIYQSFLAICDYILSKISPEQRKGNFWVEKLVSVLEDNLTYDERKTEYTTRINNSNNSLFEIIDSLTKATAFKSELNMNIIDYYKNIFFNKTSKITNEDINNFFLQKICVCTNLNGSLASTAFLNNDPNNDTVYNGFAMQSGNTPKAPYISTPLNKKFCLVLDLDETMISFQMSEKNQDQGCLRIRPGLDECFKKLKSFYEIIVFTAGTKEYADPILDAIEDNQKLIDYRLYREHTAIIGSDFVKDISKIGRGLDKTVIVDNMPQNFRLQKENGILINSFWGEDENDTALFELSDILLNIAKNYNDIREGLKVFKDDITKKVTLRGFNC